MFCAFVDLKNTYDSIYCHGMWQTITMYGVGGKMLKAEKSFHVDSRPCVTVRVNVTASSFHLMLD